MKLSVIIVNYNVVHFLEQCLHSVFKAGARLEMEVIVVDNRSVDDSVEMVKQKFQQVKLIANTDNVGFSAANNQGLAIAQGEYVLLLNPDTVVQENTFDKVIAFMDSHADAGGLGVKMLDGKGVFLPESKRGLPTPAVAFYKIFGLAKLFPKSKKFGAYHLCYLDKDQVHEVDVLSGAFMLLRKALLDKIGGLDEAFFMYGEDIDLSYRIQLAGYKNYYFPDTRIIHYKGESTKKGSINYVFVFYRAMIIFARKHFSARHAKLFSALIHLAIYFRAFLAILQRLAVRLLLPISDAVALVGGIWLLTQWYGGHIRFHHGGGSFPAHLVLMAAMGYAAVWQLSVWFAGGYDRVMRLGRVLAGIGLGSCLILIVYSLLPESLRFSRAIILLGTLYAVLALLTLRWLIFKLKWAQYRFFVTDKKAILVVGSATEVGRVKQLLAETSLRFQSFDYILESGEVPTSLALNDLIRIYGVEELIFCARDIAAQTIIGLMLEVDNANVDYKIAPPESLSVIGSNSINTSGDLYTIGVNSVTTVENRRKKRLVDLVLSAFLLLFSPFWIWKVKSPSKWFSDLCKVFFGNLSLVGLPPSFKGASLKPGILTPSEVLGKGILHERAARIDLLYVKEYKPSNDLNIVLKAMQNLGDY